MLGDTSRQREHSNEGGNRGATYHASLPRAPRRFFALALQPERSVTESSLRRPALDDASGQLCLRVTTACEQPNHGMTRGIRCPRSRFEPSTRRHVRGDTPALPMSIKSINAKTMTLAGTASPLKELQPLCNEARVPAHAAAVIAAGLNSGFNPGREFPAASLCSPSIDPRRSLPPTLVESKHGASIGPSQPPVCLRLKRKQP